MECGNHFVHLISADMSKGAPKKPAAIIRAEQKFVCAKAELCTFDHGARGSKETKWAQVRSNFGGFATKFVANRPSHPVWDAYLVTPVERLWMPDAKATEKMSGKQLSDRGAEAIAELRNVYMPLARKLFPNGMKSGDTKWDSYNEKLNNALYRHYEVKLEKDRNRKTKTPKTWQLGRGKTRKRTTRKRIGQRGGNTEILNVGLAEY